MTGKTDKEDEAKRTLKRLEAESERLPRGVHGDQAEDDRIEMLGKRIARILSFVLAAGLVYYLWTLL
jgi:hypothetical protein